MNKPVGDVTTEELTNGNIFLTVEHGPSGCQVQACCTSADVENVKVELQEELCLIIEQVEWWLH